MVVRPLRWPRVTFRSDPGVPSGSDPGIPQINSERDRAPRRIQTLPGSTSPFAYWEDQKDLWLFPTQLARGKHWVPTVTVTLVTGALIDADPHDEPYFRNNSTFTDFSKVFSTTNTGIVEIGVPVAVYLTRLLRHDSYTEQTAMLAGEAYLDSAIPHVVMKLLSRRLRPSAVPPQNDFRDTFFRSHVGILGKGSSFPSGHAAAAFSSPR